MWCRHTMATGCGVDMVVDEMEESAKSTKAVCVGSVVTGS